MVPTSTGGNLGRSARSDRNTNWLADRVLSVYSLSTRNLMQTLAHEGDHLIGNKNLTCNLAETPNSQHCSNLP